VQKNRDVLLEFTNQLKKIYIALQCIIITILIMFILYEHSVH